MEIKLRWKYAQGEFDTKTIVLTSIPGRTPAFGQENEAELAIEDGYTLSFAQIHLGNIESSNAFAEELVRRWNEFPEELKQ
jgi:hypothetical protein